MDPDVTLISPTKSLYVRGAALILDGFLDYNERFADITRRARRCFEHCDWRYAHADAVARIDLYEACIGETLGRLELLLDERIRARGLWAVMRGEYAVRTATLRDRALARTYFNSLSRQVLQISGVDKHVEFVALSDAHDDGCALLPNLQWYPLVRDTASSCMRLLEDFSFANGYTDRRHGAEMLGRAMQERWDPLPRFLQMLPQVFYRERRAYLVGTARWRNRQQICVVALVSTVDGVRVHALLTEVAQVSILFGYARSYFHVDLETVDSVVKFLAGLMPHKPVSELYTVLGRAKQGKTERYCELHRYLGRYPGEQMVHADGERGMVMAVFTPPSHAVVIKVIRDRFAYPKDTGRRQVERKYRLVFHYDRIGRLVDAQEFRDLRIPLERFSEPLLRELCESCAATTVIDGADLLLKHCYIERRLRPLNLYVREASEGDALRAVLDYGQAIKDLARSNIFPGDLLLKNFGISRSGRAIFYDYDELCLVDQCRFRKLPEGYAEDELRPLDEWVSARDNDVFPEIFPHFLGLPENLREILQNTHGELFDPAWWQALQARLGNGEYLDVSPYPEAALLPDY